MKIECLLLAAVIAANAASPGTQAAGRFDIKLSPEQKIQLALNRLTFGARPGDFEDVRRMGVQKWIELQLHPERIAENPVLDARLKPLETIRMATDEVIAEYFRPFAPARQVNLNELLPGDQFRKVMNGTAEERKAAIEALSPEKRMKVLAFVGPNVVAGLPELQKEQTEARRKQQEEQRIEMRRLRPPLSELLESWQVQIALRGSSEQRAALYASLDSAKLRQVAAALPPNAVTDQPEFTIMNTAASTPP